MPKEKEQQGDEMVEVSRTDLKALMDRVQRLENPMEVNLDEPTVHYVSVRLADGLPISRVYDVVSAGLDPVTHDEVLNCKLDVVEDDGKVKQVKANYLEMLRDFPTVKCELVKTIEKDASITQGKVAVKTVEGYNMISTGVMVPLKVKMVETTFVVKLPTGREVELMTVNI